MRSARCRMRPSSPISTPATVMRSTSPLWCRGTAAAGVAAVVIEDKTFPKDSSLRPGGRQILVPIEEFQGKIEAARLPGGPLVVARTEALIAGLGQDEALRRGAAYAEAGADAVLIHSKERTPDEILEFCLAWSGSVPLVLVPTAYPWRRRRPGEQVRRCRSSQSRQQAATSPPNWSSVTPNRRVPRNPAAKPMQE